MLVVVDEAGEVEARFGGGTAVGWAQRLQVHPGAVDELCNVTADEAGDAVVEDLGD